MTEDFKVSKKQKRREYKELAQHITYTDTLNNQNLLRKRVELLRRNNECIRPQERTQYFTELSKALFGEGLIYKVYLPVKHGRVYLGYLHYFGEKLGYTHTNTIKIEQNEKEYIVNISVLWDLLLEGLLYVFPFAQRESHRRSAEREKYEGGGVFSYEPSKRY